MRLIVEYDESEKNKLADIARFHLRIVRECCLSGKSPQVHMETPSRFRYFFKREVAFPV